MLSAGAMLESWRNALRQAQLVPSCEEDLSNLTVADLPADIRQHGGESAVVLVPSGG